MSVSFKKPPIHEVALSCAFLPRPDLLIPHLGSFWAEIEQTYPSCQHAAPIMDSPDAAMQSDIPLPRIWFTGAEGARLVQLQQDRIIFNWRAVGESPYVRFPAVRSEFERVLDLFERYVVSRTKEPIRHASYSLTYVNLLNRGEGWSSVADIDKVFPDLGWREGPRFLPTPIERSSSLTFEIPNQMGKLTATLQPGKLVKTSEPVIRFELTATSGSLGGKAIDLGVWTSTAHEWIVRSFKDLTSEHMHRNVWLIEDGEA
jgi:uncharacterized protein (TIGR04255 family)